jgi:hypothetical protein
MSRRRPALRSVTSPDRDDLDHGAPHRHADGSPVADPLACLADPLEHPAPPGSREQKPVACIGSLLAGAVDAVAGADVGSVSEIGAKGVHTWAATLPVAEELDRLGGEWGEGPLATTLGEREPAGTVTVTPLDGAAARRWPRWSVRARSAGVATTLSVVLPGGRPECPVVLALHGPDPSSFGPSSMATARAFAAPLAVAVVAASRVAALERALESRDVIGQAKGLLMARHGVDDPTAFQHLVAISQHTNVRLADVAARMVGDHASRSRGLHCRKLTTASGSGASGETVDPPAVPDPSEEGIAHAGR